MCIKTIMSKCCHIDRTIGEYGARAESFLLLAIRLWIGEIFLRSGINKAMDYLDGNGGNVVDLFEYVHPVPLIPAEIAAPLATVSEVVLGALLVLGLFSRFPAIGLLLMTILIQIAMPQLYTHGLWALLLLVLIVRGTGPIAADHFLKRAFCKDKD